MAARSQQVARLPAEAAWPRVRVAPSQAEAWRPVECRAPEAQWVRAVRLRPMPPLQRVESPALEARRARVEPFQPVGRSPLEAQARPAVRLVRAEPPVRAESPLRAAPPLRAERRRPPPGLATSMHPAMHPALQPTARCGLLPARIAGTCTRSSARRTIQPRTSQF